MIAVAALWRWDGIVVALIFMFTGSMRPGEALSVTSSAVVLSSRWRRFVVVALWRHKSVTRGRARGAHHVVFDEGLLVDVLEAHVQRLADDALVVGLKPHAFRRKFDAILAELGLESVASPAEQSRSCIRRSDYARNGHAPPCCRRPERPVARAAFAGREPALRARCPGARAPSPAAPARASTPSPWCSRPVP